MDTQFAGVDQQHQQQGQTCADSLGDTGTSKGATGATPKPLAIVAAPLTMTPLLQAGAAVQQEIAMHLPAYIHYAVIWMN